jgi:hypothetical protein
MCYKNYSRTLSQKKFYPPEKNFQTGTKNFQKANGPARRAGASEALFRVKKIYGLVQLPPSVKQKKQ